MSMNARCALVLSLLSAPVALAAPADPRRTPIVEAVERATPAVVTIRVQTSGGSPFSMFHGGGGGTSEGSGVIVGADGVVITNAHVVDGAEVIEVHLSDGRVMSGTLVASDPSIDIAVLRLAGVSGLPTLPLGDSGKLLLGEPAIAIGNPYGLGLTVSTGVVASTGRDVSSPVGGMQTYIQTDAAINPGNSGGALVNVNGELIGINTFVHSAGEGIGFAIPVNRARKITGDLLLYGAVQLPWLGADLVDRPPTRTAEPAVAVLRMYDGGPGVRGGLLVGDLVVEVAGHKVGSRGDVNARLAERSPGDAVEIVVLRSGARQRLRVETTRPPDDLGVRALRDTLGVSVEIARAGRGVAVSAASAEGAWTRARLQAGDVIVAVEGQPVANPEELVAALARAKAGHRAVAWFTVARGTYRGSVEVGI